MYDHRIGLSLITLATLTLLALPFTLTCLLLALISLATTLLLAGHFGAFLSHLLHILLPIPILTAYLDALASPYALLVAAVLGLGFVAVWAYVVARRAGGLGFWGLGGGRLGWFLPAANSSNSGKNSSERSSESHHDLIVEDEGIDTNIDDRSTFLLHNRIGKGDPLHLNDNDINNDKDNHNHSHNDHRPDLSDSNPFIRRILRNHNISDPETFSSIHDSTLGGSGSGSGYRISQSWRRRPLVAGALEFPPPPQPPQSLHRTRGNVSLRSTAGDFQFTPRRERFSFDVPGAVPGGWVGGAVHGGSGSAGSGGGGSGGGGGFVREVSGSSSGGGGGGQDDGLGAGRWAR